MTIKNKLILSLCFFSLSTSSFRAAGETEEKLTAEQLYLKRLKEHQKNLASINHPPELLSIALERAEKEYEEREVKEIKLREKGKIKAADELIDELSMRLETIGYLYEQIAILKQAELLKDRPDAQQNAQNVIEKFYNAINTAPSGRVVSVAIFVTTLFCAFYLG